MLTAITVITGASFDMLAPNGMLGFLVGMALTASLIVREVIGPLSSQRAAAISRMSWAAITPLGILFAGVIMARVAQAL